MLEAEDRVQRALESAYAYLNRRDRTEAEVRRRLEQQGVDASSAEVVVSVLIEQRYLDDARFARLFAADKRQLEEWGSERIRRTLLARGVDCELVEEALEGDDALESGDAMGAEPADAEFERAIALLRRRFPVAPRERRERDRALGILLRKGYDGELALDALSAYARDAA
jgi:regulatory protein